MAVCHCSFGWALFIDEVLAAAALLLSHTSVVHHTHHLVRGGCRDRHLHGPLLFDSRISCHNHRLVPKDLVSRSYTSLTVAGYTMALLWLIRIQLDSYEAGAAVFSDYLCILLATQGPELHRVTGHPCTRTNTQTHVLIAPCMLLWLHDRQYMRTTQDLWCAG